MKFISLNLLCLFLLVLQPCHSFAQAVESGPHIYSFNDQWRFLKAEIPKGDLSNEDLAWQNVSLPHTWNEADPFDEEPGYYRGVAWYTKTFRLPEVNSAQRHVLRFEGVNQECWIFVNGKQAGHHLGGYTAFNVDLTDFLKDGENALAIKVDNSHHPEVPPLKGDFNFYGGIYRDVWMHVLESVHFELSRYGDKGIFITTPSVSEKEASLSVRSEVRNTGDVQNVLIRHQLFAPDGQLVSEKESAINLKAGVQTFNSSLPKVTNPQLWQPDEPNLYRLVSGIYSPDGQLLDEQANPVGFRWFRFDADRGFFLNGKSLKLVGSNRHQDYVGLGNALSNERHVADLKLIKDMGSNFLRPAHYPQDPVVLQMADELGLLVTMEIPLDHDITDSEAFLANSKFMLQEMIRQYFNHPSIIIWAYMNEMMLGRQLPRDQEITEKIAAQAKELEALLRQEDPTRFTMIPNHGALNLYIKAGLTEIPMIVGWNLYYGWYEPDLKGAGDFLDEFHRLVPDKPTLITEYGAGADPRIRSFAPERFDFSVDWQNRYHQQNLLEFMKRDFLAGMAVWNIADFGSADRIDAVPGINNKGLVGFDRNPKDAYLLYQSWLKPTPFISIGSCGWNQRQVRISIDEETANQTFEVYANSAEVALTVNGTRLGRQKVEEHITSWQVPLRHGKNLLIAESQVAGKTYRDACEIDMNLFKPEKVNWSEGIFINSGATFHFTDAINGLSWWPDQPFEKGLWGYEGGEFFRPRDRGIGSDMVILGTDIDPVYQTHRVNPEAYRFDVEPGTYEINFYWAETDLAYKNGDQQRTFNVIVNDQMVLKDLNITSQYGFATAVKHQVQLNLKQPLLKISFEKIDGAPMISAIGLRKLY